MTTRTYATPTVRTLAGTELVERLGPVSAGSVNTVLDGFGGSSPDDRSGSSSS